MEISNSSSSIAIAVSITVVAIVTLGWKLGNWIWFRPKKLERSLRRRGFSGNPYRFFYGDWKENTSLRKQAQSKPSDDFSHDVTSRVSPFLRQLIRRYGENSFMWIGPKPRVIIMNPGEVKDVFMKIAVIQKRLNPLFKLLVPGVASYEGDKWAMHRKIINPAFHQDKLKLMLPQMYESCNMMIENWNKLMPKKESCEVDVWPYLQKLSCDVISRSAFGSNYEQGKLIFDLLKELAQLLMRTAQSVYIPGWRFLPTKINIRINQIDKEIKASLKNIIQKREEAMKIQGEEGMNYDLLGLLMESNMREIEEKGSDKNMGLSINDVMDECKLFYFAGQETTSVLLVWTMILLAKYPNWQASAREEVMQVFGKQKPHFEGLNHLKVVNMILYEVLRLYPPVVLMSRRVNEETRVGDLVLPAGVEVSVPTSIIHQDRKLWGDDASEFKPDRFSGGVSKATKYQGAFLPFGFGPRICVGQNFALIEAKMALALILQNFTFDLSPSYSHAPHTVITLRLQYGAPLILHKI